VHLQILYVRGNLHAQQSVVLVEMAAKVDEVVIPAMLLVDIGPGGSCLAINAQIGDECGGSTGSSEPRSGSGDNSMNRGEGGQGGQGGDANVNIGG
jgi:hypothetical protein